MASRFMSRSRPGRLAVRRHAESLSRRKATTRALREEVVSLAGLVGAPVCNQAGQVVGRLDDIVARVHGGERYPLVSGFVVRVGGRRSFLDASAVIRIEHGSVSLRSAKVDLREFNRRPGEMLLARDVLDHQLVDLDGVQVVRAADLYLATFDNVVRLVGVDVSLQTLLRRLGPKRWRGRPTPERVIDWAAVESFGDELTDTPAAVRLRAPHAALRRLRPGELADLLEDLGRSGRQELLAALDPAIAADALEEMDADELEALLREVEPNQAAQLIVAMEPDEAVDALREFAPSERDELLARMPERTARQLTKLLDYRENQAGGFMTTTLVRATAEETIGAVRERLAERAEHRAVIDAVAVVDEQGLLIADIPLFDLVVTAPERTLAEVLTGEELPAALTVHADAGVGQVASRLIESRHSSILVVDDERRPLGRILADDVIDALTPDQGRLHFPRLLQ